MKTLVLKTPNHFTIETQLHPSRGSMLAWLRRHGATVPRGLSAYCSLMEGGRVVRVVATEKALPYSADMVHEYLHAVDFLSPRIPRGLERGEVRAYLLNALLEYHKAWFENGFRLEGLVDTTAKWYLCTALSYEKGLDGLGWNT